MVHSSGGEEWQKPSSQPVVLCNGLLFLPTSGLDVDSWWWCCGVSVRVCVLFWLTAQSFVNSLFLRIDPVVFGFQPLLVLLLVWKACAGILSFLFEVCPPGNGKATLCVLGLPVSVIQILWMNCLFALSDFAFLIDFFSVPLCSELCMPLSAGQGNLLVWFHDLLLWGKNASDSHCDTNTNYSRLFNEWLLTPGLYLCFAPLLHYNEGFGVFVLFLETVLHKRWSALTNRWCVIILAQLYGQTMLATDQIWHETLPGSRIDTYTDRPMFYCCVLNVSLRRNIAYGSKAHSKWKGFSVCLFLI